MINEIIDKVGRGENPPLTEFVNAFTPLIPLLGELEKTPQDTIWHGEGNVHVHTSQVLQNLYQLLEQEKVILSPEKRIALVLATVFHDIAKPLATREKEINGELRIVAPHHEEAGASYLAPLLLKQGIPYSILFQTLQLVMTHNIPKRLVIKGAEKPSYCKLARQVDLELLYYLTKADMLGRLCPDKEQQVELIDLFRLFVEEFKLWRNANPYSEWIEVLKKELFNHPPNVLDYVMGCGIRDFEREIIHSPHEAIARAYPRLNSIPELFITCGMSGSGKSTWIEKNKSEFKVISQDNLRKELLNDRKNQSKNTQVLSLAMESLKESLRKNERVVWDATSLRRDMREKIIHTGENYKALTTLVAFHLHEDELYKRNLARTHPVSKEVLIRQLERFQWPQPIEAHRFLILDSDGNILHRSGYFDGI